MRPWPWPLRILLPAALIAALLGIGLIDLGLELREAKDRVQAQMRDRASVVGTLVGSEIEARLRNREPLPARRAVTDLVADRHLRVAVFVGAGDTILFATDPVLERRPLAATSLARAAQWLPGRPAAGERFTHPVDGGVVVLGVFPVGMPGPGDRILLSRTGALILEYDVQPFMAAARSDALRRGALTIGLVLLVALALWAWFTRIITRRADRLVRATEAIADGRVVEDRVLAGSDELATLGTAIATMSRRIERARAALEESEGRYRGLVDRAPIPVAVQVGGVLRFVNRAALTTLGAREARQLLGRSVFDIVHPADHHLVRERTTRALREGGELEPVVERLVRLDGRVIEAELNALRIEYEGEAGIQVLFRDVTEERRATRALKRRDDILSGVSFVAHRVLSGDAVDRVMPDVLRQLGRATDTSRVYIFVNERDADGTEVASYRYEWTARGISPQLGVPELQAVPWDPMFSRWRREFDAGRPVYGRVADFPEAEQEILRPQAILALAAVPIHVTGRLWGFMGFDDCVQDRRWSETEVDVLTTAANLVGASLERRQAEDEVRRSEAKLRGAQRIAKLGNWEWDIASDRIVWSDEVFEIFGLDQRTFPATYDAFLRAIHPDDRARFEDGLRRALTGGAGFDIEHRVVQPGGAVRTVYGMGQVVLDGDGQPLRLVGTVQDITVLREAERERHHLEAQLRQSQKLEAVGQLSGGIAHDFNNLLAVITANAELIGGAIEQLPDAPLAELADLKAAARSGADLVKGLLGFSRRAELRLAPLNLEQTVADMSGLLRRLIPASIEIRVVARGAVPSVRADGGAVQQILFNLVTNARDAMPDGGRLTIELSGEAVRSEDAAGQGHGAGTYGCIAVRDTGSGMDRSTLERIFEPFFTTKPPGSGTGLGLAMVHGLTRQHDGFVRVESEPGRGTTFRVGFPVAEAPHRVSGAHQAVGALAGGKETVLLVEDQDTLRRTAIRVLERLGYTVIPAADGREALGIFETQYERIQLVVSDLVMPEMGGLELFHAARKRQPDVRFLFMSGYTARDVADRAKLPEDFPFVPKPWTIEEFATKVREALAA